MTLYIFDKDGTLCRNKNGKTFINSIDEQELIPGVKEKIDSLRSDGHLIGIASNQGGVAFGHMTYRQASDILEHASQLIGGADWWVFCPFHPEATEPQFKMNSSDRKPGPGMLLEIMAVLDEQEAIFIGDRAEDQEAAKRAGVKFVWASDFFNA